MRRTALLAVALLTLASAAHGQNEKPRPFARADIAGRVSGPLTRTAAGGCIVKLRVKPDTDTYAPIVQVWIPVEVATAVKTIGFWCDGIKLDDYLSVKATLDGWNCGPDLCGRPWVRSVVSHLRPLLPQRRK